MTKIIGACGGYRRTWSFGFTCLIYHATTAFCRKNYDYRNDPLGKTVGQMVGAARSARQNLVEGSSRAGTSKETELRLVDVAKGSLEELAGDYEAYLTDAGEVPWSEEDPRVAEVRALQLDRFEDVKDQRHAFGAHILAMRKRFSRWLENDDPQVAANAILIVIDQANALIRSQMEHLAEEFTDEGGFTERMSRARLERRDAVQTRNGGPKCPKCGSPMRKMVARKGRNAGNPFWSCMNYPNCDGTRSWGVGGGEEAADGAGRGRT